MKTNCVNRIVFLTVLVFGLSCVYSCSDRDQDKLNNQAGAFPLEQARSYVEGAGQEMALVDFDRPYDSHHPRIFPEWQSARNTTGDEGMVWEVPVFCGYDRVIVAGRRGNEYVRPFEKPLACRLLLSKDLNTGQINCRMLTLVGENAIAPPVGEWQKLNGFAVISTMDGKPVQAYQTENGQQNRIVAGNARLKDIDGDFYCFCFQLPEVKDVLSTKGEEYDTTYVCMYCGNHMEYCICGRCPDCHSTMDFCVCHSCANKKNSCSCNDKCPRCNKLLRLCMCPPPTATPTICSECGEIIHTGKCIPCRFCRVVHKGNCPPCNSCGISHPGTTCSIMTQPFPCQYGNIYCPGMSNCICCPLCLGMCKCIECHHDPCTCPSEATK